MSLIIPANTLASGGFAVDNSCRFNSGSSDDLRISDYSGAGTSRRIRTYSMWIKRSELSYAVIFGSSGKDHWVFTADHKIQINIGSGTDSRRITDMVFRDVSAWYHIVFAYDTTQGTASNRFTMWVNGAVATTSIVGGKNEVAQNEDALVFINNDTSTIGSDEDSASYCDCYMAEWVFVDGQKLDADSFGEYDSDSGIWKPKDVSGINLGTNGFYLNFADSSDLGIDAGNDNDFEPTNLTAIDQTTDTPTNNFATGNPLDNGCGKAPTFSEGNLKYVSASTWNFALPTIGVSSGKWYMEIKFVALGEGGSIMAGITDQFDNTNRDLTGNAFAGGEPLGIGYYQNGNKYINNAASSYGSTYTTGDIIGTYLDVDNSKLYFAKNGTLQNSGTGLDLPSSANSTGVFFFMPSADKATIEVNYGNPTFTGTDKADVNGYGNFEYDPSAGTFDGVSKDFLALCTKNLAEYG